MVRVHVVVKSTSGGFSFFGLDSSFFETKSRQLLQLVTFLTPDYEKSRTARITVLVVWRRKSLCKKSARLPFPPSNVACLA